MLQPWNNLWPEMREYETLPLPLVVHLSYPEEGWQVDIGFVTDIGRNGFAMDPIFIHREPYHDNDMGLAEASRVHDAAVTEFARRMRVVLAAADGHGTASGTAPALD